ncbi:SCP2 sterol-binding domain-containing protein [Rhizomonospora bruguierae]|uniref:SCP2 sterol-binding domain-containing protein n=1 Tax=Rhizomonospora bruguierae TaxID=1581705 RepID=UPI001BCF86BB|nr:SCP2 sterol-binding domain-containing protein [Micromonospora sp. NBRC 107566]
MTIADFFEQLGHREHEVRLEGVRGSIQFEIERGDKAAGGGQPVDTWFLRLDRGDIEVAHERRPADCVVRTGEGALARIARGEENAIASLLRGAALVEGNLYLLVSFERLLPSPPGTRDPRARYQEAFR